MHASFGEEGHEAEFDFVFLLELVFVLVPQSHHFGHVHLVVGGEHGGGVLRLFQAARDGLAQLGHFYAFFAGSVCLGARSGWSRSRCRSFGCVESVQNVLFHHATVFARASNRASGHVVFCHQFLCGGCVLNIFASRCGSGGSGSRSRSSRFRSRSGTFAFVDVCKESVNTNGVAFVCDDIAHHASSRRRHFDGDLIGFQLAQHFVNGDRITWFLEPSCDGGFGDAFAQSGHADFDAHGYFPSMVSASLTRASCWALCWLARPVAGDADGARPA